MTPPPIVERRSTGRRLADQWRYQNRLFWRSPVAAFFTIVLPLFLLVVLGLVFGDAELAPGLTSAQFYGPALAVFGAVSATYTNIATRTAIDRDEGLLKRIRGTPLPPWIHLAGRVGSAVQVAVIAAAVMLGVAAVLYGVRIRLEAVPAAVVTFAVGVACFAALGLLVAALIPTGDAAPAVVNATLLPLAFISDVFIRLEEFAPRWLATLADLFPLRHFALAFSAAFDPRLTGPQWAWDRVAVMALWGAAAAVLALRTFTWEPRGGERARGRRRR